MQIYHSLAKHPKTNCDISTSEIKSENEDVILYTTNNNNSHNDSYHNDCSEDEEKIVNTYTAEHVEDKGIGATDSGLVIESLVNCD